MVMEVVVSLPASNMVLRHPQIRNTSEGGAGTSPSEVEDVLVVELKLRLALNQMAHEAIGEFSTVQLRAYVAGEPLVELHLKVVESESVALPGSEEGGDVAIYGAH